MDGDLRALPRKRRGTAALVMSKSLESQKAEETRSVAELESCRTKNAKMWAYGKNNRSSLENFYQSSFR